MKKHRPIKHAHRKAMIAQKKAKGKYSRPHLPKPLTCLNIHCCECWAAKYFGKIKNCTKPWYNTPWYKSFTNLNIHCCECWAAKYFGKIKNCTKPWYNTPWYKSFTKA